MEGGCTRTNLIDKSVVVCCAISGSTQFKFVQSLLNLHLILTPQMQTTEVTFGYLEVEMDYGTTKMVRLKAADQHISI
jgi:hypothetical protein